MAMLFENYVEPCYIDEQEIRERFWHVWDDKMKVVHDELCLKVDTVEMKQGFENWWYGMMYVHDELLFTTSSSSTTSWLWTYIELLWTKVEKPKTETKMKSKKKTKQKYNRGDILIWTYLYTLSTVKKFKAFNKL